MSDRGSAQILAQIHRRRKHLLMRRSRMTRVPSREGKAKPAGPGPCRPTPPNEVVPMVQAFVRIRAVLKPLAAPPFGLTGHISTQHHT